MRRQRLQRIRTFLHLFILFQLLGENPGAGLIGACSVDVVFPRPIHLREFQQQRRLCRSATGTLFHTLFPRRQTVGRVRQRKINVADGIVDLVQIFGVVLIFGHTSQTAYHLLGLVLAHDLRLQHTRRQSHFVGRIGRHHARQGTVGFLLLALHVVELTDQEVQTGPTDSALGVLHHMLQSRQSLIILLRQEIVCRLRIGLFPRGLKTEAVTPHASQHVFSIVGPSQCHIATGQSGSRHLRDTRLRGVEPNDVVPCSAGFDKLSFSELSLSHHKPSAPQIGIELSSGPELLLFRRQPPVAVTGGGFFLDAVLLDGLLCLLDGGVEVAGAQRLRRHVLTFVHRKEACVVVLIASYLRLFSLFKGHLAVVQGVKMRIEGVPPPVECRVSLHRTARKQSDGKQENGKSPD